VDLVANCDSEVVDSAAAGQLQAKWRFHVTATRQITIGAFTLPSTITSLVPVLLGFPKEVEVTSVDTEMQPLLLRIFEWEFTANVQGADRAKVTSILASMFSVESNRITLDMNPSTPPTGTEFRVGINILNDDDDATFLEVIQSLRRRRLLQLQSLSAYLQSLLPGGQVTIETTKSETVETIVTMSGVLDKVQEYVGPDLTPTLGVTLFTNIDRGFALTNPIFVKKMDGLDYSDWVLDEGSTAALGMDCTTDGSCVFKTEIMDSLESVCSFTGLYTVQFDVECAEGVPASECAVAARDFTVVKTFYIEAGNHCPNPVGSGVTLEGSLMSYSTDPAKGPAKMSTSFLNDVPMFFQADVYSPEAALEAAEITEITVAFKESGNQYTLYETETTAIGSLLGLTTDGLSASVPAGTVAKAGDNVSPGYAFLMTKRFLRDKDESGVFVVTATVEVVYSGLDSQRRRRLLTVQSEEEAFSSPEITVSPGPADPTGSWDVQGTASQGDQTPTDSTDSGSGSAQLSGAARNGAGGALLAGVLAALFTAVGQGL